MVTFSKWSARILVAHIPAMLPPITMACGCFGISGSPIRNLNESVERALFLFAQPVENDIQRLRDGAFDIELAAAPRPFVDESKVRRAQGHGRQCRFNLAPKFSRRLPTANHSREQRSEERRVGKEC